MISVTLVVKNGEKYLSECLSALETYDEIILLDNGSEDRTLEIAARYSNVKIIETPRFAKNYTPHGRN